MRKHHPEPDLWGEGSWYQNPEISNKKKSLTER